MTLIHRGGVIAACIATAVCTDFGTAGCINSVVFRDVVRLTVPTFAKCATDPTVVETDDGGC